MSGCVFVFNDTATTEIYTLSLHDALPISGTGQAAARSSRDSDGCARYPRPILATSLPPRTSTPGRRERSEEHTPELQSRQYLVCRLLLEQRKDVAPPGRRRPFCPLQSPVP